MAAKDVTVVVEGSDQPERKVTLLPGTTVGEALVKAGLHENDVYMLAPDSTRLLDPKEDLYAMTDPGEKLGVSSPMDAGAGWFRRVLRALFSDRPKERAAEPAPRQVVSAPLPSGRGRGPRPRLARPQPVESRPPSLERWLRKNGWKKEGSGYRGHLRTGFGTVRAKVEDRDGGWQVFVHQPPAWLLRGRKSECVIKQGRGWFWIHQNSLHRNVIDAIRAAEVFLLQKREEDQRRSA